MDKQLIRAYDLSRDFSNKGFYAACYAPFLSMYFDTLGYVRACCQNVDHTLGNLLVNRLDEIWTGEKCRALRDAMQDYQFHLGCRFCEWQISDGQGADALSRSFDMFPVPSATPEWPTRMEFSVSNTCNLECIMCNGEWSSSIRSRREKLPPLPKPYSDQFFEDLRKYLPHLELAKFLGGEPFLARESFRVWDLMIEQGLQTSCHVTTNGTQYNDRVERVLENLPISFCISMDGATKKTVESVRVNANYETLMENFRRFYEYSKARGTSIALTYCLMPQNSHELGDYLLFAESHGLRVWVNTVIQPVQCSLFQLPAEELAKHLERLERQDATIRPQLKLNRGVWEGELHRLRHHLEHRSDEKMYFEEKRLADVFDRMQGAESWLRPITEDEARAGLSRWSGGGDVDALVANTSDTIEAVQSTSGRFLDLQSNMLVGQSLTSLHYLLKMRFGFEGRVLHYRESPYWIDQMASYGVPGQPPTYVCGLILPRRDADGKLVGTLSLATARAAAPATTDAFLLQVTGNAVGPPITLPEAEAELRNWSSSDEVEVLVANLADRVEDVRSGGGSFQGRGSALVGQPLGDVQATLLDAPGSSLKLLEERVSPHWIQRTLAWEIPQRPTQYVQTLTIPRWDSTGRIDGSFTAVAWRAHAPGLTDIFLGSRIRGLGVGAPLSFEETVEELHHWSPDDDVDVLVSDIQDRILEVRSRTGSFQGIPAERLVGRHLDDAQPLLASAWGPELKLLDELVTPHWLQQYLSCCQPGKPAVFLRKLFVPRRDDAGRLVGAYTCVVRRGHPPGITDTFLPSRLREYGQGEPLTLAQAERELACWSPGQAVHVLVTGLFDVVREVRSSDGTLQGIPAGELIGKTLLETLALGMRYWGTQFERLHERVTPHWLEQHLAFAHPGQPPTYFRMLVIPRRDGQGRIDGSYTCTVVRSYPPGMSDNFLPSELTKLPEDTPLSLDAAGHELAEWSHGGSVYTVRCDFQDRIRAVDVLAAESGQALPLDLPSQELLHKPAVETLMLQMAQRFGDETRTESQRFTRQWINHLVSFRHGDKPPRYVRSLILPVRDAAGRMDGVAVILAARREAPGVSDLFLSRLTPTDETMPADVWEARDLLRRWSRNGRVDALHCGLSDAVLSVDAAQGRFLELSADAVVGHLLPELPGLLAAQYCAAPQVAHEAITRQGIDRVMRFGDAEGVPRWVRVLLLPRRDEEGRIRGSLLLAAVRRGEGGFLDEFFQTPVAGRAAGANGSAGERVAPLPATEVRASAWTAATAAAELRQWSGGNRVDVVVTDMTDRIREVDAASGEFLGTPAAELLGQPLHLANVLARKRLGDDFRMLSDQRSEQAIDQLARFEGPGRAATYVRTIILPTSDEAGCVMGARLLAASTTRPVEPASAAGAEQRA